MSDKDLTVTGDPEGDPVAYLREFVQGEVSHNPEKLTRAYLKLAEQCDDGVQRDVYCALAWAIGNTRRGSRVSDKIKALEERIRTLEERLGSVEGRTSG